MSDERFPIEIEEVDVSFDAINTRSISLTKQRFDAWALDTTVVCGVCVTYFPLI